MSAPMSIGVLARTRLLNSARCAAASACQCLSTTQSQLATTGMSDAPHSGRSASMSEQFKMAVASSSRRPIFRTSENNPSKHTDNHVGLFYSISPEDFDQWMKLSFDHHFRKMSKAFNETSLMVRKPATEIIQCMRAANYDMPVIRYLLYGRPGSGKSCTLAHVVHACGKQGWLVLYLPWAGALNRYSKEVQASTHSPGLIDQPLDAAAWLARFRDMNAPLLQEVQPVASREYIWSKREVTEPGTPLLKTIEFGLGRVKYATDILGVLLREIKIHAAAKRFRVLVAIDGVNALWSQTVYKKESNPRLKYLSEDLALVHFWKKMLKNDWVNGAVVCTVDPFVNLDSLRDSFMPKYLLGKEGLELFDPMIPIHVPGYSEKEFDSAFKYLVDRKWIHSPKESDKKELQFLTEGNPYELYRVTRGW